MIDEVLTSGDLWKCTTCFACVESCPQGIRVTDILWELKALAFQSGKAPDFVLHQRETLMIAGRIYPVGDRENRKRREVGLPSLPEGAGEVIKVCAVLREEKG